MKHSGTARRDIVPTSIAVALMLAGVLITTFLAQKSLSRESPDKKEKKEPALKWDPPQVDDAVQSVSTTPACVLPDVLSQAGERANELVDHLKNFIAHERIRYEQRDRDDAPEITLGGRFDYMVDFEERFGQRIFHETRTPLADTKDERLTGVLDKGLPALGLIFYPSLRSDYEMHCAGSTRWNNQAAWLVYFRQKKEKRARTLSVRTETGVRPVGLKGRAWIAKDSGQIMRLETNLVEGVPVIDLVVNSVSVDYTPVRFQSQNIEVWLPRFAVGYFDYNKRRMIIEHTFSDFQLFSIQTDQVIQTPKEP